MPVNDASLQAMTAQYTKANDRHEASLVAVEVTDPQRLLVLHEIYAECRGSGGSTVVALGKYQDKVQARMADAAGRVKA